MIDRGDVSLEETHAVTHILDHPLKLWPDLPEAQHAHNGLSISAARRRRSICIGLSGGDVQTTSPGSHRGILHRFRPACPAPCKITPPMYIRGTPTAGCPIPRATALHSKQKQSRQHRLWLRRSRKRPLQRLGRLLVWLPAWCYLRYVSPNQHSRPTPPP